MEMGYHFSLKREFKETNTNSQKWKYMNAALTFLGQHSMLRYSRVRQEGKICQSSSLYFENLQNGMDVTKLAVDHVNKGQIPVTAFDQPLYALAKQVQCNWNDHYG